MLFLLVLVLVYPLPPPVLLLTRGPKAQRGGVSDKLVSGAALSEVTVTVLRVRVVYEQTRTAGRHTMESTIRPPSIAAGCPLPCTRCSQQDADTRSTTENVRQRGEGSGWRSNLRPHRYLHHRHHVSVDMVVDEEKTDELEKEDEEEEEEKAGEEVEGEGTSVHVRMFARPSGENWWVSCDVAGRRRDMCTNVQPDERVLFEDERQRVLQSS